MTAQEQTSTSAKILLIAAVIQGALYSLIKTIVDRGGARMFQRLTGEWPGG